MSPSAEALNEVKGKAKGLHQRKAGLFGRERFDYRATITPPFSEMLPQSDMVF